MLNGLLLEESLADTELLGMLRITRTETWQVANAADFQPNTWTAISFEVDETLIDTMVERLSHALKPRWYINGSTMDRVYVIFPGRIFVYPKGDALMRSAARQYGLSAGIPDRQLDWGE